MDNETKTSYLSIAAKAEGLYKEKGSRFLAFAEPICSEAEVRERLVFYRKAYHDARHVCFAYKLGEVARSSDDGEPSGTAGKPIMGRIESAGLDRILIVVVRYFGGILLGTGGLVVAYREASADALAHAQIIECDITATRTLHFGYEQMHEVMRLIKETDARILRQDWDGSNCEMEVEVSVKHVDRFEK
jgi:uncharacterized YigZ family protein